MSKPKTKKTWIAVIAILVVIGLTALYYSSWIKAYYYDYTGNHFKPGDKVYARGKLSPYLYRIIRPITTDDIEKLNIDDDKKALAKQNLKNGELQTLQTDEIVDPNGLHTGDYIGTFISRQFIVKHFDGKTAVIRYYAIKPNWRVISNVPSLADPMPNGYTYADDKLYVAFFEASDK